MAKTTAIEIPAINIEEIQLTLIGISSLICHRWSEKAKQEMRDKQMKKAQKAKEAKNPEQLFKDSLYPMPKGKPTKYGFPAIAFKAAAVGACRSIDGLNMTTARTVFHVVGELVPIHGEATMREDMVRIGQGTADLRYRGEFKQWYATLNVSYNADVFSAEQLLNLFQIAGYAQGIGEWRPEKNGSHGMFHIATEKDIKDYGIKS
jgi:hypothetical protein